MIYNKLSNCDKNVKAGVTLERVVSEIRSSDRNAGSKEAREVVARAAATRSDKNSFLLWGRISFINIRPVNLSDVSGIPLEMATTGQMAILLWLEPEAAFGQ